MAELDAFPPVRLSGQVFFMFSFSQVLPPIGGQQSGQKTPMDRQRKHWITLGFAVLPVAWAEAWAA